MPVGLQKVECPQGLCKVECLWGCWQFRRPQGRGKKKPAPALCAVRPKVELNEQNACRCTFGTKGAQPVAVCYVVLVVVRAQGTGYNQFHRTLSGGNMEKFLHLVVKNASWVQLRMPHTIARAGRGACGSETAKGYDYRLMWMPNWRDSWHSSTSNTRDIITGLLSLLVDISSLTLQDPELRRLAPALSRTVLSSKARTTTKNSMYIFLR